MVNERKEPTLSTSSLKDPRNRKGREPSPTNARQPSASTPKAEARPKPKARPAAPVAAKSNNGFVFFVLILTLIALAVAAYNMWQLQQANSTILDQQVRIVELEQKLTLTGDSSSQSITSLAANFSTLSDDVKLSLTEIDKLWATRNVNKDAITANAEKLSKVEKTAQSAQGSLTNANQKITALETASKTLGESVQSQVKVVADQLASLTEQAQAQTGQLSSIEAQAKRLAADNAELERLAQTLKTQTSQQEITLQSLRERVAAGLSSNAQPAASTTQQLNQLSARVRENQEAISAIDAFRITVNRELLLLKQRNNAAQ